LHLQVLIIKLVHHLRMNPRKSLFVFWKWNLSLKRDPYGTSQEPSQQTFSSSISQEAKSSRNKKSLFPFSIFYLKPLDKLWVKVVSPPVLLPPVFLIHFYSASFHLCIFKNNRLPHHTMATISSILLLFLLTTIRVSNSAKTGKFPVKCISFHLLFFWSWSWEKKFHESYSGEKVSAVTLHACSDSSSSSLFR